MVNDARSDLERVRDLLMRLPPAMRNHYLIRAALDTINEALNQF